MDFVVSHLLGSVTVRSGFGCEDPAQGNTTPGQSSGPADQTHRLVINVYSTRKNTMGNIFDALFYTLKVDVFLYKDMYPPVLA